jgi:hypothetical protein
MAAITTQSITQDGSFAITMSTLTASDTITFTSNSYILFYNSTAGSLTAVVKGSSATSKNVDGIGSVSLSAGVSVVVPAGEFRILNVNSRDEYMVGTSVTITGAATLKAAVLQKKIRRTRGVL